MTGAQELGLLLRQVPPFPELAAELVAVGGLTASGARSAWQAAAGIFRTVKEGVRRVREQRRYEAKLAAIVRADPDLQELDREQRRRLARNRCWAAGGPGQAERITGSCLDAVLAVAVRALRLLPALRITVTDKAAGRRERGKR